MTMKIPAVKITPRRAVAGIFSLLLVLQLLIPFALAAEEEEKAKEEIQTVVNRVVRFIQYLAIGIGSVMFAYAGLLWLQGGKEPAKREKAKSIIEATIVGVALATIGPLIAKWLFMGLG